MQRKFITRIILVGLFVLFKASVASAQSKSFVSIHQSCAAAFAAITKTNGVLISSQKNYETSHNYLYRFVNNLLKPEHFPRYEPTPSIKPVHASSYSSVREKKQVVDRMEGLYAYDTSTKNLKEMFEADSKKRIFSVHLEGKEQILPFLQAY
jgi:hypothetical protein